MSEKDNWNWNYSQFIVLSFHFVLRIYQFVFQQKSCKFLYLTSFSVSLWFFLTKLPIKPIQITECASFLSRAYYRYTHEPDALPLRPEANRLNNSEAVVFFYCSLWNPLVALSLLYASLPYSHTHFRLFLNEVYGV